MASGISLSNKSQLLFGVVVVVVLGVALSVPWFLHKSQSYETQREIMRQLADAWMQGQIKLGQLSNDTKSNVIPPQYSVIFRDPLRINVVDIEPIEFMRGRETSFYTRAIDVIENDDKRTDYTEYMETELIEGKNVYHYARSLREYDMRRIANTGSVEFDADAADDEIANRLRALLVIDRSSEFASGQQLVVQVYLVAAWLFTSLLAIFVFYFILTKLIFSPVRKLRVAAEKVQEGDTSIRASIQTGDEFEQLADAFNSMLERLGTGQQQLRSMNQTLDLRLSELAEANFALFESNRLKGEFLASVSHELRTPLNSIIGFSELLDELAQSEEDADPKRRRYVNNIVTSARSLLEMINDLLELAKIEAGRVDFNIESKNITDLLEGLQTLMKPLAEKNDNVIELNIAENLPLVETDAGKLQQILYNYISNALKFSPEGEKVIISAEREVRQNEPPAVRIGVIDNGPGIPQDMQDVIFEKFRQADASHTRIHQGVGLGLAICRELAELLNAKLSIVSEPGRGAAFYVEVPFVYKAPAAKPLMETASTASENGIGGK